MPNKSEKAVLRCIERIERFDPELRAFITVLGDQALESARIADQRGIGGPLHGVPVVLKDSIDVANVRCTVGSAAFADRIAATDATLVTRLRAAGAIILGKTNLHEFCYGGTTQNETFGGCRNPWDTSRVPGGSSGGSAVATACGMTGVAIGGDTGASIRVPAAFCGVSGLRPTHGAIPNSGTFPISPPYDTHGPMARSVVDLAHVFSAIAGHDPADPFSTDRPAPDVVGGLNDPITGVRVLVPRNFFFDDLGPGIGEAVKAAARVLERLGAHLYDDAIPGLEDAQPALNTCLYADAAEIHAERLRTEPEKIGRLVRDRLRPGRELDAITYARHRRWLEAWEHRIAALLHDTADVVLAPSAPCAPVRIDAADDVIGDTARLSRFGWAWAAARIPAISVPCGFDPDGLPIGLQLAAAKWREPLLLRVAHAYQKATDWHRAEPPVI